MEPLIWLHEEALRTSHPVFNVAPPETRAIFIWDDPYFQKSNYSLKRLVFIYETLCELPCDIFYGETVKVIQELSPPNLYIPATQNPELSALISRVKSVVKVQIVAEEDFVKIKNPTDFKRFFQYWKKAERSVFLKKG